MKLNSAFSALLLFFLASGAFAAKKKAATAPSLTHEAQPVTVSIPQSELDVGGQLGFAPSEPAAELQLGISTWSPDHYTRSSLVPGAGEFHTTSLPRISLSRISPLVNFPGNGAGVFWVGGVAYSQLERTAEVRTFSVPRVASQTLSLTSLRVGVEYQGPRFSLIEPFLGVGVLPTYALASQTELEERVSSFGFPFEAEAGLLFRPGFLREFWSMRNGTIGLGAHYLFGNMDGSRLSGLGVQGSLAVTL